jgi:hypothetical protein
MENRRKKMDVGSSIIASAIKEFSEGVKKIEKMKMEMIERIVIQMFQNEHIGRKLIVQGQLQMATLFAEVLKPTNS